jgi:putative transposase
VKYAWIHEHRGIFDISAMCRCLGANRPGYYRWAKDDHHDESDLVILAEIKDVMNEVRWSYGVKRMTEALKDRGFHINKKRVERIMKEHNIRCRKARKKRKTTDSSHKFPASRNKLKRQFDVKAPNRVWVSDITYLRTRDGWLYLCTWIDLFSRRVVGWATSSSLASEFVTNSLELALSRRPGAKPLIHSDRGVQYASKNFRDLLKVHKLKQSMSRKGNCWDNACAESFFATIKSEAESFDQMTAKEAKQEVFEYIELFYNRKRKHSTLGYKTPAEVEEQYQALKAAS